jgi:eukaryotic-like serine/threonine-protein kinase
MANWDLIESILNTVLLLPPQERVEYVEKQYSGNEQLINEVLELLNSIDQSENLFSDAYRTQDIILSQIASQSGCKETNHNLTGTIIDKYKIVKLISHGGMGTVYMAERCDGLYKQKVALKLIRHGMDTPDNISRFEKERFILSGLNHPNIAGLIDGGVSNFGLPYLIMEYVDGVPIDDYCDQNRLEIKQRIELFNTICSTVQYAHNNMVIHRDLKPDNILVDKNGVVKILDFGIAKLLQDGLGKSPDETHVSQQILTPGYGAPEQVLGEPVTTATDTYSLGILLYRLLTGTSPYDFKESSFIKQQNLIVSKKPDKPSVSFHNLDFQKRTELSELRNSDPGKVYQELKVDLDAIICKSLRKEPGSRYQTADALSDDLKRYLSNIPVLAHKGDLRYKTTKFIRRNYKTFSVAALFLIMFMSLSLYHTYRISVERNQAQTEAQKAAQITSLLFNLFEASDPAEAAGDTITAQELLYKGITRAEMLEEQPALQAQMYHIIGQIFYRLGNYNEAGPLLESSNFLYENYYGPDHPETALSMGSLGALRGAEGDYKTAEILLDKAVNILKDKRVRDNTGKASLLRELANVKRRQGDFVQAEELFRQGYDLLNRHYGPDHIETINLRFSYGTILFNTGKYSEAEAIYREVLAKRQSLLGDKHPDLAQTQNSLAALLMNTGNYDEAEILFNQAYQVRLNSLGQWHPQTLLTLNNLAVLNREIGNFEVAIEIFSRVLDARIRHSGEKHVSTAITYFGWGELYSMINKPEEARELFEKALPIFEQSFSERHSFTIRTKMNIGQTYLYTENPDVAEELITNGYEQLQKIHGEKSLERALADHQMGLLYHHKNELELADVYLKQAYRTIGELEKTKSVRQKIIQHDLDALGQEYVAGRVESQVNR